MSSWSGPTRTGGPRTTCRSARSTCARTLCCASRSRSSTPSRGCSGIGGRRPGLNFIYAHLNRVIRARDLSVVYVTGPGHGGPGIVANVYLEGTYTEVYPHIGHDVEGIRRLFRQFSFPGGIPSHVAPETPGSIHEGGELGYSLAHAYGAAFDNPELLVCCVVGDGEAETGRARDELALQQVPEPRARWRGAAGAASQRLQDRQPDGPGTHLRRGAALTAGGLRLRTQVRRGRRSGGDAPADGGDAGRGHRPRSRRSSGAPARTASRSGRAGR